jgi:xylulose-5-phosphate/fructose-6-phosphate phosphoketolase
VLPILHLNGYGYHVYTVEGDDPKLVHQQLAATMDTVIAEIQAIQRRARKDGDLSRPA